MTCLQPKRIEPGRYWAADVFDDPAPVDVLTGPRGGAYAVIDGKRVSARYNAGRWRLGGRSLFGTLDAAVEFAETRRNAWRRFAAPTPSVVCTMSTDELKRVRSRNHPDKNPGGDVALYQQAIVELKKRR